MISYLFTHWWCLFFSFVLNFEFAGVLHLFFLCVHFLCYSFFLSIFLFFSFLPFFLFVSFLHFLKNGNNTILWLGCFPEMLGVFGAIILILQNSISFLIFRDFFGWKNVFLEKGKNKKMCYSIKRKKWGKKG